MLRTAKTTRLVKLLAVAGLVAAIAGTAIAAGPGGGRGPDPARMTQHLDTMKENLGITAEQQAAWDGFVAAMTKATEARKAARSETDKPTDMWSMSLEEHKAYRDKMRATMEPIQDQMFEARKALYDSLTDEQKAKMADVRMGGGKNRGDCGGPGKGMMNGPAAKGNAS